MLRLKETMAITMIDPVNVAAKRFEEGHLLAKLRKTVVVTRISIAKKSQARSYIPWPNSISAIENE